MFHENEWYGGLRKFVLDAIAGGMKVVGVDFTGRQVKSGVVAGDGNGPTAKVCINDALSWLSEP